MWYKIRWSGAITAYGSVFSFNLHFVALQVPLIDLFCFAAESSAESSADSSTACNAESSGDGSAVSSTGSTGRLSTKEQAETESATNPPSCVMQPAVLGPPDRAALLEPKQSAGPADTAAEAAALAAAGTDTAAEVQTAAEAAEAAAAEASVGVDVAAEAAASAAAEAGTTAEAATAVGAATEAGAAAATTEGPLTTAHQFEADMPTSGFTVAALAEAIESEAECGAEARTSAYFTVDAGSTLAAGLQDLAADPFSTAASAEGHSAATHIAEAATSDPSGQTSEELCVWQRVLFASRLHQLMDDDQGASAAPAQQHAHSDGRTSPSAVSPAAAAAFSPSEPVEILPSINTSGQHTPSDLSASSLTRHSEPGPDTMLPEAWNQHQAQQQGLHQPQPNSPHAMWLRQLHHEALEAAAARAAAAVAATEGRNRFRFRPWGSAPTGPGLKLSPQATDTDSSATKSSAEAGDAATGSLLAAAGLAARPGYSISRRASTPAPAVSRNSAVTAAQRRPRAASLSSGYRSSLIDPVASERSYRASAGNRFSSRAAVTDKLLVQLGQAAAAVLGQQQLGASSSRSSNSHDALRREDSTGSSSSDARSSTQDSTACSAANLGHSRSTGLELAGSSTPARLSTSSSLGTARSLKGGEVLSAAKKAGLLRQVSAALAAGTTIEELLLHCDACTSSYTASVAERKAAVMQQGQQQPPRASVSALQAQQQHRRYSLQLLAASGEKQQQQQHARAGRLTWSGPGLAPLSQQPSQLELEAEPVGATEAHSTLSTEPTEDHCTTAAVAAAVAEAAAAVEEAYAAAGLSVGPTMQGISVAAHDERPEAASGGHEEQAAVPDRAKPAAVDAASACLLTVAAAVAEAAQEATAGAEPEPAAAGEAAGNAAGAAQGQLATQDGAAAGGVAALDTTEMVASGPNTAAAHDMAPAAGHSGTAAGSAAEPPAEVASQSAATTGSAALPQADAGDSGLAADSGAGADGRAAPCGGVAAAEAQNSTKDAAAAETTAAGHEKAGAAPTCAEQAAECEATAADNDEAVAATTSAKQAAAVDAAAVHKGEAAAAATTCAEHAAAPEATAPDHDEAADAFGPTAAVPPEAAEQPAQPADATQTSAHTEAAETATAGYDGSAANGGKTDVREAAAAAGASVTVHEEGVATAAETSTVAHGHESSAGADAPLQMDEPANWPAAAAESTSAAIVADTVLPATQASAVSAHEKAAGHEGAAATPLTAAGAAACEAAADELAAEKAATAEGAALEPCEGQQEAPESASARLLQQQLAPTPRTSSAAGIGSCKLSNSTSFDGNPYLANLSSSGQLSFGHSQSALHTLSGLGTLQGEAPAAAGQDGSESRRSSDSSCSSFLGRSRSASPCCGKSCSSPRQAPPTLSVIGRVRASSSGGGTAAAVVAACALGTASSGPLMVHEHRPVMLTASQGGDDWDVLGQGVGPEAQNDPGQTLELQDPGLAGRDPDETLGQQDGQDSSDNQAERTSELLLQEQCSSAEEVTGAEHDMEMRAVTEGTSRSRSSGEAGIKSATWGGSATAGDSSIAPAGRAKPYSSCAGTSDTVTTHRVVTYQNVTTVVWRERQAQGLQAVRSPFSAAGSAAPALDSIPEGPVCTTAAAPTAATAAAAGAAVAADGPAKPGLQPAAEHAANASASPTAPTPEAPIPAETSAQLPAGPQSTDACSTSSTATAAAAVDAGLPAHAGSSSLEVCDASSLVAVAVTTGVATSSGISEAAESVAISSSSSSITGGEAPVAIKDEAAGVANSKTHKQLRINTSSSTGTADGSTGSTSPTKSPSKKRAVLSPGPAKKSSSTPRQQGTAVRLTKPGCTAETSSSTGPARRADKATAAEAAAARAPGRSAAAAADRRGSPAGLASRQIKRPASALGLSSSSSRGVDSSDHTAPAATSSSTPSSPITGKKKTASITTTAAPIAALEVARVRSSYTNPEASSRGSSGGGSSTRQSGSKLLLAAAASRPGSPLKKLLVAAAGAATGTAAVAAAGKSKQGDESPKAAAGSPTAAAGASRRLTAAWPRAVQAAGDAGPDTTGSAPASPARPTSRSTLRASRKGSSKEGLTVEVPVSPASTVIAAPASPSARAAAAAAASGSLSAASSPLSSAAATGAGLAGGPSSSGGIFSAFGRSLGSKSPSRAPASPKAGSAPHSPRRRLPRQQQQQQSMDAVEAHASTSAEAVAGHGGVSGTSATAPSKTKHEQLRVLQEMRHRRQQQRQLGSSSCTPNSSSSGAVSSHLHTDTSESQASAAETEAEASDLSGCHVASAASLTCSSQAQVFELAGAAAAEDASVQNPPARWPAEQPGASAAEGCEGSTGSIQEVGLHAVDSTSSGVWGRPSWPAEVAPLGQHPDWSSTSLGDLAEPAGQPSASSVHWEAITMFVAPDPGSCGPTPPPPAAAAPGNAAAEDGEQGGLDGVSAVEDEGVLSQVLPDSSQTTSTAEMVTPAAMAEEGSTAEPAAAPPAAAAAAEADSEADGTDLFQASLQGSAVPGGALSHDAGPVAIMGSTVCNAEQEEQQAAEDAACTASEAVPAACPVAAAPSAQTSEAAALDGQEQGLADSAVDDEQQGQMMADEAATTAEQLHAAEASCEAAAGVAEPEAPAVESQDTAAEGLQATAGHDVASVAEVLADSSNSSGSSEGGATTSRTGQSEDDTASKGHQEGLALAAASASAPQNEPAVGAGAAGPEPAAAAAAIALAVAKSVARGSSEGDTTQALEELRLLVRGSAAGSFSSRGGWAGPEQPDAATGEGDAQLFLNGLYDGPMSHPLMGSLSSMLGSEYSCDSLASFVSTNNLAAEDSGLAFSMAAREQRSFIRHRLSSSSATGQQFWQPLQLEATEKIVEDEEEEEEEDEEAEERVQVHEPTTAAAACQLAGGPAAGAAVPASPSASAAAAQGVTAGSEATTAPAAEKETDALEEEAAGGQDGAEEPCYGGLAVLLSSGPSSSCEWHSGCDPSEAATPDAASARCTGSCWGSRSSTVGGSAPALSSTPAPQDTAEPEVEAETPAGAGGAQASSSSSCIQQWLPQEVEVRACQHPVVPGPPACEEIVGTQAAEYHLETAGASSCGTSTSGGEEGSLAEATVDYKGQEAGAGLEQQQQQQAGLRPQLVPLQLPQTAEYSAAAGDGVELEGVTGSSTVQPVMVHEAVQTILAPRLGNMLLSIPSPTTELRCLESGPLHGSSSTGGYVKPRQLLSCPAGPVQQNRSAAGSLQMHLGLGATRFPSSGNACDSSKASGGLSNTPEAGAGGSAAAGAVADGLTGILTLVKQLQGNLAGLESDMQQLHGALHRRSSSTAESSSLRRHRPQ